jgi:phosphoribosylformylglycinamidine cyclo-ligase
LKILDKYDAMAIHGMVHCSGGAQTKILHFVENLHIIKDNLFPSAFVPIDTGTV